MSHSSPWFLVACASAIVHRNHFCFHQKDECSESKVKFRQISNCYKIALEPAKMAYANKIKDSTTSQKFGSQNFWQMANSALKEAKSAIALIFNGLEVLPSVPNKSKLFAEDFSNNFNLNDSGISVPVLPSRTNLKLHNVSVTTKMLKNVIMNLEKHLVLIVFQWWF